MKSHGQAVAEIRMECDFAGGMRFGWRGGGSCGVLRVK